MARVSLDGPPTEKTTLVLNKMLMERMSTHARRRGDTNVSFITRAIVNQMENDGDITIRADLEEEANG